MSLVSLVTFQTVSQKRKLLVGLTLNVIGNGNGDVDVDGVGNGYGYGGMVWVWVWLWVWGDEDEDDDDDDDSTLHFTPGSLHSPSLSLSAPCAHTRPFLSLHCAKSIHPAQQQQQQHLDALWAQTIKGSKTKKKKKRTKEIEKPRAKKRKENVEDAGQMKKRKLKFFRPSRSASCKNVIVSPQRGNIWAPG